MLGVTDLTWILWDHKCVQAKNNSSQIHFQQLWQSFHDNQDSCHHIMVAKFLTWKVSSRCLHPKRYMYPTYPNWIREWCTYRGDHGGDLYHMKKQLGETTVPTKWQLHWTTEREWRFSRWKVSAIFPQCFKKKNHPARKQSYLRVLSKTHEKQWIIYAFPSWRITPL